MPELPEVETIRRQLHPRLIGSTIVDGGSHWSAKFTPALEAIGDEISDVTRRGKYLIVKTEGDDGAHDLIIHLGMTGRLAVNGDFDPTHSHLRAWWRLHDDSTFTFHDARRFGACLPSAPR